MFCRSDSSVVAGEARVVVINFDIASRSALYHSTGARVSIRAAVRIKKNELLPQRRNTGNRSLKYSNRKLVSVTRSPYV